VRRGFFGLLVTKHDWEGLVEVERGNPFVVPEERIAWKLLVFFDGEFVVFVFSIADFFSGLVERTAFWGNRTRW